MHRGVTNYKTLLEEVRHWRLTSGEDVCIVTFNYDTMIEEALEVVGLKIREIPDYIAHPNYKLFKVHGSVQWVRELDMPFQAYSLDQRMAVHQLIGNAASLNVSNRFKIRAGDFVAARGLENGGRMEDGAEHTLEEVGRCFDVTRERIRQIEAKALRKLRHSSRLRELRLLLSAE